MSAAKVPVLVESRPSSSGELVTVPGSPATFGGAVSGVVEMLQQVIAEKIDGGCDLYLDIDASNRSGEHIMKISLRSYRKPSR